MAGIFLAVRESGWYTKRKRGVAMIHLFNRKELLTTASMERQAQVRDALAANGIECWVRVRSNTGGATRSRTVVPGMRMDMMYQYDIYVKRADYEKAKYLIR